VVGSDLAGSSGGSPTTWRRVDELLDDPGFFDPVRVVRRPADRPPVDSDGNVLVAASSTATLTSFRFWCCDVVAARGECLAGRLCRCIKIPFA